MLFGFRYFHPAWKKICIVRSLPLPIAWTCAMIQLNSPRVPLEVSVFDFWVAPYRLRGAFGHFEYLRFTADLTFAEETVFQSGAPTGSGVLTGARVSKRTVKMYRGDRASRLISLEIRSVSHRFNYDTRAGLPCMHSAANSPGVPRSFGSAASRSYLCGEGLAVVVRGSTEGRKYLPAARIRWIETARGDLRPPKYTVPSLASWTNRNLRGCTRLEWPKKNWFFQTKILQKLQHQRKVNSVAPEATILCRFKKTLCHFNL